MSVRSSSPDPSDVQVIPMDRWREEGKTNGEMKGSSYRSGYTITNGTFLNLVITLFAVNSFHL